MKSVRILLGILLLLGLVKISFSQEEAAPVAVSGQEMMGEDTAVNGEDMVNVVAAEDEDMAGEPMEAEANEVK